MTIAMGLLLAGVFAAKADAAYYKMVACAGNNGAPPYSTGTNTTSGQNPGGIFELHNWCGGAGGDPPGEAAYMRIVENQSAGSAGNGAYGHFVFDTPGYVHFKAAGGYTRQPNAFNDGWRARFWLASACCSAQIMTQGAGLPNASGQWASSNTFGPHLWPYGEYWDFTRFVYEMTCVRAAGCDRANYNATDLNGLVFILSDDSNSQAAFTGASSLLAGSWVRGTHNVTFNVADLGSGIRHERMRIDGAQRWGWDHWPECNTSSSGVNGEWARAYVPCPTGGPYGRSVPLDTATLADGAHTITACTQDYGQYQGLNGTGSESCDARTIRVDNTAPGAPSGLAVTSANPQRYLDRFGAIFSLPPNQGSPVAKVHYNVVNAAGEVVKPVQTLTATNPTALAEVEGPAAPGEYRLRVWLEDTVGLQGPAATAEIPRDTTPPAAPQGISVAAPSTPRVADGFDVRWHNIVDAGAPIDAVHYQVLNGAGEVVVATKHVSADNVEAIESLDAPNDRGAFTLRLWLTDAEGNVGAPASAPLAYECVRSPVQGGQQLSADFGDAATKTVEQGSGAVLSGDLRGVGAPTAFAPVCVFSRVLTDPGRDFLGIAVTGASGDYRFAIAAGPSRELSVAYRPGQRQLSASAVLQTRVKPTLRAAADVIRNKTYARFSGEIPGPHNNEVVIVLQVKQGDGWLAFRRYRTRNDGRYELAYYFRRTTRPTTYEVRAQVRETTGYPYLEGDSDPILLRVLPDKGRKRANPAAARKRRCAKRGRRVNTRRSKVRCAKRHQRGKRHQR